MNTKLWEMINLKENMETGKIVNQKNKDFNKEKALLFSKIQKAFSQNMHLTKIKIKKGNSSIKITQNEFALNRIFELILKTDRLEYEENFDVIVYQKCKSFKIKKETEENLVIKIKVEKEDEIQKPNSIFERNSGQLKIISPREKIARDLFDNVDTITITISK